MYLERGVVLDHGVVGGVAHPTTPCSIHLNLIPHPVVPCCTLTYLERDVVVHDGVVGGVAHVLVGDGAGIVDDERQVDRDVALCGVRESINQSTNQSICFNLLQLRATLALRLRSYPTTQPGYCKHVFNQSIDGYLGGLCRPGEFQGS